MTPAPFARAVALYSLGWLVAANLVGLWLAASILWPQLGDLLSPLTFGRWAPLHLDWQLYGWCSLPLVGVLFAWFLDPAAPAAPRHAHLALAAWSLALALGGLAWLGGVTSGKPFLDWHAWTRPLLPLAMTVLWLTLARHTHRQWPRLPRRQRLLRATLLTALAFIPAVLFWTASRHVYPSINPDSGGATGSSILGASLGIISLYLAVPALLHIPSTRPLKPFLLALVATWLVYALAKKGHVSHHSSAQVAALTSLLLWIPLLPLAWRAFAWPEAARPWLYAAAAWWTFLALDGWITFLPGLSERLKFTHFLVAHAHLAMAGLVTSVNAAILVSLTTRPAPRATFWLWQLGCAVYVAAMSALGWFESAHAAELFRSEPWTQALFAARLLAGLAMTAASVRWLASHLAP